MKGSVPPRPWSYDETPHGFVYIKDANGKRIVTVYGNLMTKIAAADFIIEAVNAAEGTKP